MSDYNTNKSPRQMYQLGELDGTEAVPVQSMDSIQVEYSTTQDIANLAQKAAGVTQLIASGLSIDANTTGDTILTYEAGKSLATHTVLFIIVTYGSGTLDPCLIDVKTTIGSFASASLTDLTSTSRFVQTVGTFVPDSGDITCTVNTPSDVAGTFNVFVYGIVNPQ